MRFSLNFVKEFVDIDVSAKALADTLTMAGMEVEYLEKCGNDWLVNIEVTTNRYDWLSIIGIAREVAACLGKKANIKYPQVIKHPLIKDRKIIIEDRRDCPLYVGRSLRGLQIKDSPPWLKERVANCDVQTINNVVDITNYCMLKWGNPLHAFDEDKIQGNIYIRRAKRGESFIGIDEKERTLTKENLVIADDKKVIALAGVMGAKNTEVDENTKNVFLEAALFSPLAVRHSRRSAAIDTDSSYRFERRVFSKYVEYASFEGAKLIGELAKGEFAGYLKAGKEPVVTTRSIPISLDHLKACVGVDLSKVKVKKILESLDFRIKDISKDKLQVFAPLFRFDINREVDCFEEICRIYGYSKIEPKIPFLARKPQPENTYEFKNRLRRLISLLGLKEIITYSIENDEDLKRLDKKEPIVIVNPMRKQENSLRTTLLGGMLKSINYNLNRNNLDLRFFEIAHVYYRDKNSFSERGAISLGASGGMDNFFYLKKVISEILNYLNIEGSSFKEEAKDNFGNALKVMVAKQEAGFIGKLDERLRKEFDLRQDLYFCQLDIDLLREAKKSTVYKPFSPYPAVSRDISLALAKSKKFSEVKKIIAACGSQYLEDLQIIDVYEGKDISKDHFAFTLRIFYQSKTQTLTSQEVDSFHKEIRDKLSREEGIVLR